MQGRDLEEAQQHGLGVVAGEAQLVVVAGDSRNDAQDPDQQEHGTDNHRCLLNVGAGGDAGAGVCCHDDLLNARWIFGSKGGSGGGNDLLVQGLRLVVRGTRHPGWLLAKRLIQLCVVLLAAKRTIRRSTWPNGSVCEWRCKEGVSPHLQPHEGGHELRWRRFQLPVLLPRFGVRVLQPQPRPSWLEKGQESARAWVLSTRVPGLNQVAERRLRSKAVFSQMVKDRTTRLGLGVPITVAPALRCAYRISYP